MIIHSKLVSLTVQFLSPYKRFYDKILKYLDYDRFDKIFLYKLLVEAK